MIRALLAFSLLLVGPTSASAQTVAVEGFDGPRARLVRGRVVRALEAANIAVVEEGEGASITGRVSRRGRRWRADIRLSNVDGEPTLQRRLSARNYRALSRTVRRFTRRTLAPSIASPDDPAPVSVPVDSAPAPALTEVDEPQEEASDPAPQPATRNVPPISFHAGLSVAHRAFSYEDDLYAVLRPYSLPAAPMIRFAIEYYPGAHAEEIGELGGLSIVTSGELALGVQSTDGNGTAYPTDAWSFGLLARYRLPVDDVAFGVHAGYQAFAFGLGDADELTPRPDLPNVEYHTVRVGGSFRWDIGLGLFFDVSAAYLHPFTGGEITSEEWFPRAQIGGLDGEGGVGIVLGDVELTGRFSIRRFWFAMNPEPGDARVAGGAVDQYLSGVLGMVYRPSGL